MFTVRTGVATVRVHQPEITARSARRTWGQRTIIGRAITGLDVPLGLTGGGGQRRLDSALLVTAQ